MLLIILIAQRMVAMLQGGGRAETERKSRREHSEESHGSVSQTVHHESRASVSHPSKKEKKKVEQRAPITHSKKECTYKMFVSCNPSPFDGTKEGVEAYEWVNSVESVLEICDVSVENKVQFATHLFKSKEMFWWQV